MNREQTTGPGHRPDHPALRLDAACDRFEADWREGRRPRIEESLGQVPESERTELFRELLPLELEFRRDTGESPTPDEYRRRFPTYPQVVADAFATPSPRTPDDRTVRMRSAADYNLLFGILALQNNFVSREALVDAFNAWVADRSRPLAQVLSDRGHLDPARAALLEALAREHLKLHGGDPQESLVAVSSLGSAREALQGIADSDVQASLGRTAVGRPEGSAAAGAHGPASGVSRFRILRPHARGGLGEVFVAYDEELHREVALKEIRPGRADERESRTRFVLEAEITGNLEHPGVVPVYGLGYYGDGRPFYAMRFVQGDSLKAAIARFHEADGPGRDPGERALALRGLLGRFIDVCDAIAYAHSRGVLHRDLKPGNIMLGKYGETLVVDWGLAKAAGQAEDGEGDTAERALRPPSASGSAPTIAGVALGTPGFMSPEQAAGELDGLGPRSDVYSLGATLYILLTGRAPLDDSDGDVEEVLRRVRAGEIAPPRQVKREVPPALEAVCLKAMALQPGDRYPSARALAEDIEHWLADEPVSAWREPWPVRARRWAKRHRTAVAATMVALMVGVVGLAAVAGVQAQANVRLKRANDKTNAALADSEDSRKQAEAVSTFLVEAFRSPDPSQDGRQVKVADILDRASERLDKGFAGSQATLGAMLFSLAETYRGLGLYDKAVALHTRAIAVREVELGPNHIDTLTSRYYLGWTNLDAGRPPEAIAMFESTLKRMESMLGSDDAVTLRCRGSLACAYYKAGRWNDAMALFESTVKRMESKLGSDDMVTLRCRNNLALMYADAGRLTEVIELRESTLRRMDSKLGPDHPDTLRTRSNLATAYWACGRFPEAIAHLEMTLRLREVKLGPDHLQTLDTRHNLAAAYSCVGRLTEAIDLYKETIGLCESKLKPDHLHTLDCRSHLASAYAIAGRLTEAIPLFESTLKRMEATLYPDHPHLLEIRNSLASAYESLDRWTDAEHLYRETVALRRRSYNAHFPDLEEDLTAFGQFMLAQSRWSEAEELLRESLSLYNVTAWQDGWRRHHTMSLLGWALVGQGRYAESQPLIVAGYEQMKAREARIPVPERSRLREAAERIVRLYEAWNKPDQAAAWKAKLDLRDLPADVFAWP
jgi:tetratricopeptide (TPR) repeat protein/tRNA A-37 threonylcarbamoyl transferase component Bud32